jgi:hypothetical protein
MLWAASAYGAGIVFGYYVLRPPIFLAGGRSCLFGIRSIFSPPPLQSGLCPCSSSALCDESSDDASEASRKSEQPSRVCGRPRCSGHRPCKLRKESARSQSGRQSTMVGPETEQINSSSENSAVRLGIRVSFYGYEAKDEAAKNVSEESATAPACLFSLRRAFAIPRRAVSAAQFSKSRCV